VKGIELARAAPAGFTLQRRDRVGPREVLAVPVLSVLGGLLFGAVFLAATGHDPLVVYREVVTGTLTTSYGLADTVTTSIPLVLAGLAAAVAFRVNLYNIGGEGQIYVGAIAATGLTLWLGDGAPALVQIPALLVAGALGGALWIAVPAALRAWFGTNETITTLMLNLVALYLVEYLILGSHSFWRDPDSPTFPKGKAVPDAAHLPTLGTSSVHLGLLVALLAVGVVAFVLHRMRLGLDMKVLGDAPDAARYAGIPVRRTMFVVLLASGALAGLAGAVEIGGRTHQLDPNGTAVGFGYTGIIVAALARLSPFGVVVTAMLLGVLENSKSVLQTLSDQVPLAITTMLEGAILIFAIGGEILVRHRIRRRASLTRDPAAGTNDRPPDPATTSEGAR
jgi:general nucleoside transport system permease protein